MGLAALRGEKTMKLAKLDPPARVFVILDIPINIVRRMAEIICKDSKGHTLARSGMGGPRYRVSRLNIFTRNGGLAFSAASISKVCAVFAAE